MSIQNIYTDSGSKIARAREGARSICMQRSCELLYERHITKIVRMHHYLSVYVAIVLRIHLKNIVSISPSVYMCACMYLYASICVRMCLWKSSEWREEEKALYVLCQSCKFSLHRRRRKQIRIRFWNRFKYMRSSNETHRFSMIHHLAIAGLIQC